jgi:hypothetical protein
VLLISVGVRIRETGINSFTLSDVIFTEIVYTGDWDSFKKSIVIFVGCLLYILKWKNE